MSKKQCISCGGLVEEEIDFCPYCGMSDFKSIGVIDLVNEQIEENMYVNRDMYITDNVQGAKDTSDEDMNTVFITEDINPNDMMVSSPISLYKPEHLRRNYNSYDSNMNNMSYRMDDRSHSMNKMEPSINSMTPVTEQLNEAQNINQTYKDSNSYTGNNLMFGMTENSINKTDSGFMTFDDNNITQVNKRKNYMLISFMVSVLVTLAIIGIYFGVKQHNDSKKDKYDTEKNVALNNTDFLNGIFDDVNKDVSSKIDELGNLDADETKAPLESEKPETTVVPTLSQTVEPTNSSTSNTSTASKTYGTYTKGEIVDGVYTNTWLNIKYSMPSGYIKGTESDYNFYTETSKEYGFYFKDNSGSSISLVFLNKSDGSKITARKFLNNSYEETKKSAGDFNYQKVQESNVTINDITYESMHCSVELIDETVIHSMYAAVIEHRIVCFIATSVTSKEDNNSKISSITKLK